MKIQLFLLVIGGWLDSLRSGLWGPTRMFSPRDGWPYGPSWNRLSPESTLRWLGPHWPAGSFFWSSSFKALHGQAPSPGTAGCSLLPAHLTFTGMSHNTCTQPHPVALPQGSVGFASDPRIPPGPSVTIRASHMKAPNHPRLTLLPKSTLRSKSQGTLP